MFPEIGVPQNGWFKKEHPIKIDDLGVPLFLETPIYIYIDIDIEIYGVAEPGDSWGIILFRFWAQAEARVTSH